MIEKTAQESGDEISPVKEMQKSNKLLKKTEDIRFWQGLVLILLVILILSQFFRIRFEPSSRIASLFGRIQTTSTGENDEALESVDTTQITNEVIPQNGVALPIVWGDMGRQMVRDGVIDEEKFREIFPNGFSEEEEQMLTGDFGGEMVMNQQNNRFILDLLWAFGLANKNDILENGEMTDEKYGGDASKFAATGGWTLAQGEGFDHYSKHAYVTLTAEQQALVDEVSRNIYRPCCGNSTHFPDCNHGMAMLGLLELMAANGADERQMYDVALKVNTLWFPQTYVDLATYFREQGLDWDQVDAKLALSDVHSSAQGYQQTRAQIQSLPKPQQGGGGCGA